MRFRLRTLMIVLAIGPPLAAAIFSSRGARHPFGPRRRVENSSRLRTGMPQKQVEALLGGQPGNYGRYDSTTGITTAEGYLIPPASVERFWYDDSNRFE